MGFRVLTRAALLGAVLGLAGCDTGGGSSPKANTPNNVQFKEKAAPESPGGKGRNATPGAGPNSQ
jgi:hypothetical protein